VFLHELVKEVDFYWRLDTDSYLVSRVAYDVFKWMRQNNFKYAYRTTFHDSPETVCLISGFRIDWMRRRGGCWNMLQRIAPPLGLLRQNRTATGCRDTYVSLPLRNDCRMMILRLFMRQRFQAIKGFWRLQTLFGARDFRIRVIGATPFCGSWLSKYFCDPKTCIISVMSSTSTRASFPRPVLSRNKLQLIVIYYCLAVRNFANQRHFRYGYFHHE
jgi:hypothetical protein